MPQGDVLAPLCVWHGHRGDQRPHGAVRLCGSYSLSSELHAHRLLSPSPPGFLLLHLSRVLEPAFVAWRCVAGWVLKQSRCFLKGLYLSKFVGQGHPSFIWSQRDFRALPQVLSLIWMMGWWERWADPSLVTTLRDPTIEGKGKSSGLQPCSSSSTRFQGSETRQEVSLCPLYYRTYF